METGLCGEEPSTTSARNVLKATLDMLKPPDFLGKSYVPWLKRFTEACRAGVEKVLR